MTTATTPKHRRKSRKSFLRRIVSHPGFIPLLFFLTSLFLWFTFISKVYVQNKNQKSLLNTDPQLTDVVAQTNEDTQDNRDKIKELTQQLLAQKEKTAELTRMIEVQKEDFGNLLDNAMEKASKKDRNYISALETQLKKTTEKPQVDKDTIAKTDYFNRVSVSAEADTSAMLQNKINKFLTTSTSDSSYVKKLTKESEVRKNEVRSIALKKGESIWLIAVRAYGDGFQYHKIMKANPHITEKSARFLAPGTMIRVPI